MAKVQNISKNNTSFAKNLVKSDFHRIFAGVKLLTKRII